MSTKDPQSVPLPLLKAVIQAEELTTQSTEYNDRILSPAEAGQVVGKSKGTVHSWIAQGLPATRTPAGYYKIRFGDLREFVRAKQEGGDA